jgi:hypothetical protein
LAQRCRFRSKTEQAIGKAHLATALAIAAAFQADIGSHSHRVENDNYWSAGAVHPLTNRQAAGRLNCAVERTDNRRNVI